VLSAAVIAAVGVTSAQAVTISNDGLGQVQLYPYYTVEGGYDTLISVVNTTNHGKAVKVRFLESLNSREVLDFNLYLSPFDVWTGKVTADAGGGAKLVVADASCTAPLIATAIGGAGEQAFFTYGFDGANGVPADALGTAGVARTRSGYIELIEMGDIDPEYVLVDNTNFLKDITHVAGVPPGCASVVAEWALNAAAFPNGGHGTAFATTDVAGLYEVSGGLAASGTLINVAKGTDYTYDPTPLVGYATASFHTAPGSLSPSLSDSIAQSQVVTINQVTGAVQVAYSNWVSNNASYGGVDAVSAALMRSAVIDEYVVNTAINAGTDWVITMPTKRWYVDLGSIFNPDTVVSHGVRPFSSLFTTGGACETIGFTVLTNQEEAKVAGSIGFSPAPVGKSQTLCWEANVITFNNSNVLASTQTGQNVNVGTYPAGWLELTFPESSGAASNLPDDAASLSGFVGVPTGTDNADVHSHQMGENEGGTATTFQGLPVIGFSVQQYVNGTLAGGVLSNYGGNFGHKYNRTVSGTIGTAAAPATN
jgi:hypothetical protein